MAAILARKAQGDATVVRKLSADSEVDDESIGFHAQRAVEKWLKAVVASRGEDFEYTHDLRRLVALARLDAEPLNRPATGALLDDVERWANAELLRGL